jgi:hypothetical protein
MIINLNNLIKTARSLNIKCILELINQQLLTTKNAKDSNLYDSILIEYKLSSKTISVSLYSRNKTDGYLTSICTNLKLNFSQPDFFKVYFFIAHNGQHHFDGIKLTKISYLYFKN